MVPYHSALSVGAIANAAVLIAVFEQDVRASKPMYSCGRAVANQPLGQARHPKS
jgi:hypothetical protein